MIRQHEASINARMQDLAGVIVEKDVQGISQELDYSYTQAVDHLYAQTIINRNATKIRLEALPSLDQGQGQDHLPNIEMLTMVPLTNNRRKSLLPATREVVHQAKEDRTLRCQLQELAFAVKKLQKR